MANNVKLLLVRVLCSIILTSVSFSCTKPLTVIIRDIPDDKHINICVLGNSYSNDAFSYVPFILQEYGITTKIHIYYRGSGSLEDLDNQWLDSGLLGTSSLDGKKHVRRHYSIDTRLDCKWRMEEVASADSIITIDKWDIISLQQVSSLAQYRDSYEPYLQNIIEKINLKCKYPFSLAWFMAYNRASDDENEESLTTQKSICEDYPFSIVFPVATAIFSCQQHESLSQLGDSKYKKMYAADNVHLQEGLPCYVAALSISQTILQLCYHQGSVLGNRIRPTQEWISSINGITPNGSSIGVTEENCRLAQLAAINAFNNKYSITPLE